MNNNRHTINRLTAEAFASGGALKAADRTVSTEGGTTALVLHGRPCMTLDRASGTLTLHGGSLPTRKTVRCMNAVLEGLGSRARVSTSRGRWQAEGPDEGRLPFGGDLRIGTGSLPPGVPQGRAADLSAAAPHGGA